MNYEITEKETGIEVTNPDGETVYSGEWINPDVIDAILSDAGFTERERAALRAVVGYP